MNKEEGIALPNFNTYQVVTIIKTMWYGQRKRHKDQWDRTKSPDINPQKYTQLIFNKGKNQLNGGVIFSTNHDGATRYSQAKK